MPAYDSAADAFYSRQDGTDQVNVVDANSGTWFNTITLDLASAGIGGGNLTNYANSFDNQNDWLVYTSNSIQRAYVFDTSGAYLGYNDLPGAGVNGSFGVGGIANGQLFVYGGGGWQGYDLIPSPGSAAILGLGALAAARRRRA